MKTYEAWIGSRLVRTFNTKDLAEQYRQEMERLGSVVVVKVARIRRLAA